VGGVEQRPAAELSHRRIVVKRIGVARADEFTEVVF
jgi:hypothetical protein